MLVYVAFVWECFLLQTGLLRCFCLACLAGLLAFLEAMDQDHWVQFGIVFLMMFANDVICFFGAKIFGYHNELCEMVYSR